MAKDNLPVYKITIDPAYAENGEDLGIEMIAFTAKPAVKVMGMAFNSQVKPMMFTDNLKYRIVAPALIPMSIYRKDDDDTEYYVSFTKEEIEKIHAKFMQDMSNKDLFNVEHDTDKKVPAYVLEAWIVDTPLKDKAYSTFGIEVPEGTLMVTAQVTDKEYYNELVKEGQVGFSIEGYLGMKLKQQLNTITMKRKTKMNTLPNGEERIVAPANGEEKTEMNTLPNGEYEIGGKIYTVIDGVITAVPDAITMKRKTKMNTLPNGEKKTEMNTLPNGEYEIGGKIYTVVDGVITAVPDEELEEETEEVALEETDVVEEDEIKKDEEALAVDPAIDAEAVLAIVTPVMDEKINMILELIAEIKAAQEEMLNLEEEDEEEEEIMPMSNKEKFAMFNKFNNK